MRIIHERFDYFSDFVFLTIYTLGFSLFVNVLFIQLPKSYIKKLVFGSSIWRFALFSCVYGLAIFTLLIGYYYVNSNPLLFINAASNGFIYGLVFYSIWKPIQATV